MKRPLPLYRRKDFISPFALAEGPRVLVVSGQVRFDGLLKASDAARRLLLIHLSLRIDKNCSAKTPGLECSAPNSEDVPLAKSLTCRCCAPHSCP